jgi:hypothetical protein
MNTDEGTASEPEAAVSDDTTDGAATTAGPNWWHRDHPVFYALTGFFTGLLTVIVVPGAFAAILNALFTYERAEDYFPFVLLIFVVPFGLIAAPRTRRFGRYMLLGMVLTAVVVVGVAALVLWILYSRDS